MLVTAVLLAVLHGPSALSLVPTRTFPSCLSNPLDLVSDPEDCHIFYQCDLNPQPMSCGDMMFNSLRQVCDWPSKVLQMRPECRQEEQFRFSGQQYPYHRTLRMLNFFGDGDQFSQKRLRAPQDVGLGRQRNVGNREYFGQANVYSVNNDVDYDNYEDYEGEDIAINEKDKNKLIKVNTGKLIENEQTNLKDEINNRILQEIRSRLPQIVQNSISNFVQNDEKKNQALQSPQNKQTQAVSTPADTIRLLPQKVPNVLIARPAPTPYIQLQQVVTQPQGPNFVYQQVYQDQVAPSPAIDLATAHVKYTPRVQQHIPAETPLPSIQELTPANTVLLGTKNIPKQQNNGQFPVSSQNQPKLAPILMEDTREFKPVWTVTRERPRQILLKYRTRNQEQCSDRNCPKLRQRVLRKIKRKLISGEKQQLQERRKELIKETKEENVNLQKFHEDTFDLDENKAITLKEAYDKAIKKVEQSKNTRPAPGNLLHEILNRDFGNNKDNFGEYGHQSYVNSDDLRSEDIGSELYE